MRGYWKLKEDAPDRPLWRTRFGRGSGSAIRQTTECKIGCLDKGKIVAGNCRYLIGVSSLCLLDRLRKITRNFSQENISPDPDLNPGFSEY
jgi:hypothetical protein